MVTSISLMLGLTACASKHSTSNDKDAQITQSWPVEKLYAEANDQLYKSNYTRAIKLYELLQSRFPNGRYAQQAQLDIAYAYYKDAEPEKSLAALDRFEQQYPRHPNLDYVWYLRGLVLFNEDTSFVNKLAKQEWSDRDPKANREAYFAFSQVVTNYPNSNYAQDATDRMIKLVDALAGHEMSVARYYMKRGAYVAAANRSQNVITGFPDSIYTEEALVMMKTAYKKLGNQELSDDTNRILAHNFPDSKFLELDWQADEIPWWRYWK